jgi:hypothetical protein
VRAPFQAVHRHGRSVVKRGWNPFAEPAVAVIVQTAIVQAIAELVPQAVAAAEELKIRSAVAALQYRAVKPGWQIVAIFPVAGAEQFVAAAVPGWSVRLPALQELYSVKAPGLPELLPEPAEERIAVVKTVQQAIVSVPETAAVLPAEELKTRVAAVCLAAPAVQE